MDIMSCLVLKGHSSLSEELYPVLRYTHGALAFYFNNDVTGKYVCMICILCMGLLQVR